MNSGFVVTGASGDLKVFVVGLAFVVGTVEFVLVDVVVVFPPCL